MAQTTHQRRLFENLIHTLRGYAGEEAMLPCIDLPLAVFGGVTGAHQPCYPIAAITTLLFLGIDLLDDLADGDLPPVWNGVEPSEIQLVATTFIATLPQLALTKLASTPECINRMAERVATGLLKMSAGQHLDLRLRNRKQISSAEVEASVQGKSGEEIALFAALAAQLAGADAEQVEHYASFGRAIGTGGQIASDCHDLFQATHSRDLANGTRTLPIALFLERKNPREREALLSLLEKPQETPGRLETIRQQLHAAGIVRFCAFIVETYCQKATAELERLCPLTPWADELKRIIDHVSFFGKGVN